MTVYESWREPRKDVVIKIRMKRSAHLPVFIVLWTVVKKKKKNQTRKTKAKQPIMERKLKAKLQREVII